MPRNYIAQDKIDQEFDFLRVDERNRKTYKALSERDYVSIKGRVKHPMPISYDLVKIEESETEFVVALLDHASQSVAYYIKANIWEDVVLNAKPVTQVLLWRTQDIQHKSVTSGLAQDVFFNYLMDEYSLVASDSHQTIEGRNFWIDKLGEAIFAGYYVYRYHRIYCDLTPIVDHALVRSNECDLWGDDEDYQNVLAIISKEPIPK